MPADEVAIVGVGRIGPARHADLHGGYTELTAQAVVAAARDAGVEREHVNGLVVNSGGVSGPDYDELARYLGLELSAVMQTWAHGRFTGTTVYQAAMMVREGLADIVACTYGRRLPGDQIGGPNGKSWGEEVRTGGGPHGEQPEIGLTAPIGNAALATNHYLTMHGVDPDEMFRVVEASRSYAVHYPGALRPKLLTIEEYKANPYVVEPLRRWDCTPRAEGAVCVIVARPGAAATPGRAVRIAGFSPVPHHREEVYHWWPLPRPVPDDKVFDRAGIDRSDVDIFLTYDTWTSQIWFGLERHGYVAPGEAPDFVREKGIGLGQGFPVNPHGGSISTGQLAGWLHIVEAVTQLRGEAGARQVLGAQVAHWGAVTGDGMIFTR
jgi:acetyl-CoA acetyltransferase